MLRMEDGAKENTALNIQKPLEILVTDEDKHGTDIACMSDFFGIYIEQVLHHTVFDHQGFLLGLNLCGLR